jgi:hypothetical protein
LAGAERAAVWIADPGFSPFGYWCGFDQGRDAHPAKGLHVRRRRPLTADQALDYIAAQLGPGDPSWPSLGTNDRGEPLTLRDQDDDPAGTVGKALKHDSR